MSLKQITLSILAMGILFFTACKKEDIQDDNFRKTSFKATISGTPWNADSSYSEMNYDADQIVLHGISASNTVTITLAGTAKGNFDLDDADNNMVIQTPTSEYTYLPGTGGKVHLTLNDKVKYALSGNFSGMLVDTLLDTLLVEAGEFTHLKYIDTTSNVGGGGGGTGGGGGGSSGCGSNMVSATIAGTPSDLTVANILNLSGIIVIQSVKSSTFENIQISMPETVTPGTYDMDASTYLGVYSKLTSSYSAETGTITVTAHDTTAKTIKGSFAFTGKDPTTNNTIEISNGSFCVSY